MVLDESNINDIKLGKFYIDSDDNKKRNFDNSLINKESIDKMLKQKSKEKKKYSGGNSYTRNNSENPSKQ